MTYLILLMFILVTLGAFTDMSTAVVVTAFIVVFRYILPPCAMPIHTSAPAHPTVADTTPVDAADVSAFANDGRTDNDLPGVFYTPKTPADDLISKKMNLNGQRDKNAATIRAHWNNNNWKKYYNYEFGANEPTTRDWWADDDLELSKRHELF